MEIDLTSTPYATPTPSPKKVPAVQITQKRKGAWPLGHKTVRKVQSRLEIHQTKAHETVVKISKRPASADSVRGQVKPKKFKAAYHCYAAEYIGNAAAQNKEAKEPAKFSVTEQMKIVAENWKKMSSKAKAKYEGLAEKDKQRYEKEMQEFNRTGYFTETKSGIHSSAMGPKPAK